MNQNQYTQAIQKVFSKTLRYFNIPLAQTVNTEEALKHLSMEEAMEEIETAHLYTGFGRLVNDCQVVENGKFAQKINYTEKEYDLKSMTDQVLENSYPYLKAFLLSDIGEYLDYIHSLYQQALSAKEGSFHEEIGQIMMNQMDETEDELINILCNENDTCYYELYVFIKLGAGNR